MRDPNLLFTLNAESIKYNYNRLLDMHTNFPPFTKVQLIEIIKQLVSDLPYEGTLQERNNFIETTIEGLIEKDEDLFLLD